MDKINSYLKQYPETGRRKLAKIFNISESKARKIVQQFKQNILNNYNNEDIINYAIDKELKYQHQLDKNRTERKIRDEYRKTNYLTELTNELINCFQTKETISSIHHNTVDKSYYGIIHISDWHLNELVNLPNNKYDFEIAGKRAKKLVDQAKLYFKAHNISNVLLFMTGDMFSATKHLDQMINMATSRGQAVFVGAEIIKQMILDLNDDFNISVGAVAGNETRESSFQNIPSSTMLMSDNLDITLFSILKLMFKDTNVRFLDTNVFDCVVNIKGKNFLFTHGYKMNSSNLQKSIQEKIGKYALQNIKISYVCFGHIHSAYVSDKFSRCGSLSGCNDYSFNALDYVGGASQNIYIVGDESVNGIVVDLQNYYETGYHVDSELIYNQKTRKDFHDVNVVKIEV